MTRSPGRRLWELGSALNEMMGAHAVWEIEMAELLLKKRRKVLIAALTPVIVILLLQAAHAAGLLPEKIPILGGSKAYMPAFITTRMFFGSILVGLIAGLITGVIGAGGGYVLTPALMSFGIRGIMAVGTDQFHLFAKAIMGSSIHMKLGNVNLGLAAWFVLGSVTGATFGGKVNRIVLQHSPAMSDAFISAVYVLVLGTLGVYAVADWIRLRHAKAANESTSREATTFFARRIQAARLAPRIRFDEDMVEGGRTISVYPVIVCGLIVGFVAAIMGVGGGFLTFPMFVYGLGVSTFTTVGTSILQIAFTTAYSSIFQYAIYGFVFYSVAVGTLLGSLIGVQIGAIVTKTVKGSFIRMLYALTILAGFSNRLCALPRKLADLGYLSLPRETTKVIETVGTVLFFGIVGVFALWIFIVFARSVRPMREAEALLRRAGNRLIVNPRKFGMGIAGLACFAILVVIGSRPIIGGRSVLVWSDDMFNRLTKQSAYKIPGAREKAAGFVGRSVDFGAKPRDVWETDKAIRLLSVNGFAASRTSEGRVRVTGDLGELASRGVGDAELAFRNDTERLQNKYDMPGEDVIYYWWAIFDSLTRRYVQENRGAEAEFTRGLVTKVFEPVYNFRGIRARGISCCAGTVTALLALYVAFTLWYGISIMWIFEGLGITTSAAKDKKEL